MESRLPFMTVPANSPLRVVRVGVVLLDAARQVRSLDGGARALLGLRHDEPVTGATLTSLLPPAEAADVTALEGRLPLDYLALSRGTSLPLLVHLTPGESGCVIGSLTSINEYLAEAQSLAHVQLRQTVESIIAGFAHEVRNPLAAILSLSESALLKDPSPDSPLVRIPSLVARVESLIKQSLAYSRPQAPRRELHDLRFLLERAQALLRTRKHAARLELPPAEDALPPVMVDAMQCEQVILNLVENALDVAQDHVTIVARAGRTTAPSVCIDVVDDGPGIADDVASRIFDPFFTTKAHGTGLGLAIARDLARLNGGDLRYVKTPGSRGALFRLYLPSSNEPVRGHW
jgi:signal transduction histidine kinase